MMISEIQPKKNRQFPISALEESALMKFNFLSDASGDWKMSSLMMTAKLIDHKSHDMKLCNEI